MQTVKHPDVEFAIAPYDVSTGIEGVQVENTENQEIIYNLQGMRVERPLAPGIYIINGQKTAVR